VKRFMEFFFAVVLLLYFARRLTHILAWRLEVIHGSLQLRI